jgi:hypothetical protein
MKNIRSQVPASFARVHDQSGASTFTRNVLAIMDRIEYRLCDSGEDLEAIYRLRYQAYLQAGMIDANPSRVVKDHFDDLPNSYRYGVYFEGNLVSTLRLHYVSAKYPTSPSTEVFGDVLMPRLAAGETFVDPSRFAADAEWAASLRVLPFITLRLAMVASRFFKPTACLTAIKEEHSGFYKRVFNAEAVVEARTYPGLTIPVYLYQSRTPEAVDQAEERFPFFKSTPLEQRMLFRRSNQEELAPLTIIPSARHLSNAA